MYQVLDLSIGHVLIPEPVFVSQEIPVLPGQNGVCRPCCVRQWQSACTIEAFIAQNMA